MPDPIDIYVGHQLKAKRIQFGMKQKDIANHIGVTFQQIQKYENGKNRIAASTLYKLSQLLKCNPDSFFEGLKEG